MHSMAEEANCMSQAVAEEDVLCHFGKTLQHVNSGLKAKVLHEPSCLERSEAEHIRSVNSHQANLP